MENITHILKGCIDGDHKCQKIVYERFRGYALKIVFRYIYRYEKAQDVINDGFVKLFNNFSKFKLDSKENNEMLFMGWLRKIMINSAIDELRKGNMLPEIGGIPNSIWEIADDNQDAYQRMLYKDLITLIKELPPSYRIVFNLYVIDGYSHSEIADMMNIPVGTSKSNLSRAKVFLQSSLKKMEEGKLCRI